MKTRFRYIYSVLAIAAVIGLFGSLMHYHSEGLDCLTHAEEQHFVQNYNTCPICTLTVDVDFDFNLSFDAFLAPESILIVFELEAPSADLFLTRPGRAPPFMA